MAKTITCIECGEKLTPKQIQAHLSTHWGLKVPDRVHCREAYERYMHLQEFMDNAGVEEQHKENSL